MGFSGRLYAAGIVCLLNIIRYFYYHQYLGLPFEFSFFILTTFFLLIAWWSGKQYDRANYYSKKDPLTDVYNRRAIESFYKSITRKYKKGRKRIGVVMIDINNFKEVNDIHGHQKGDEILQQVANVLKGFVKQGDLIARWGGDEFLLLVSSINDDFKTFYVSLLQKELANHTSNSMPRITASIGISIYPEQAESLEELIRQADMAMYMEKSLRK